MCAALQRVPKIGGEFQNWSSSPCRRCFCPASRCSSFCLCYLRPSQKARALSASSLPSLPLLLLLFLTHIFTFFWSCHLRCRKLPHCWEIWHHCFFLSYFLLCFFFLWSGVVLCDVENLNPALLLTIPGGAVVCLVM